jgi:DNA (cytosine-5)-methyltransferase 1
MRDGRKRPIRALDLFAGVGGSSYGARLAGIHVVAAVDPDPDARATYKENHPGVRFFRRKCENLSPAEVRRACGRIDMVIASPECTSHTCAKGKARRSEKSRETAFQVCRFAERLKPRWIIVENVIHMRRWRKYEQWVRRLQELGYHTREEVLNSDQFGVPQSRRRLFLVCDARRKPAKLSSSCRTLRRSAETIVDLNRTFPFSPLRKENRAPATLARAKRAIAAVGPRRPFIIVYYGTDGAGGWQRLTVPLRTITTIDRFALVRATRAGHEMRMLQVPELKRAMGFPSWYKLGYGTRRTQIRLLGNAVCPPVMRAVIRTLTRAHPRRLRSRTFKNPPSHQIRIYSGRLILKATQPE